MWKKAVVHIGYPKTATTSLQKTVFPHLQDQGIDYLGLHFEARGRRLTNNPAKDLLDDLEARSAEELHLHGARLSAYAVEPARSDTCLLSHEGFLFHCIRGEVDGGEMRVEKLRELLERLAVVLDDIELTLLLVVRRQDELLHSLYAQAYSHFFRRVPELASFDTFLSQLAPESKYAHIFTPLYYAKTLDLCREVFPTAGLEVIPYELMVGDSQRFVSELARAVGVEAPPLLEIGRENVRAQGRDQKTSRRIPAHERVGRHLLRKLDSQGALAQTLKTLGRALTRAAFGRGQTAETISISAEQRALIMQRFAPDNRRLAELTGRDLGALGYWPPD
jgi:hypothetical protein